jgi:hydroxymethylglutaryl-CoA reductase
MKEKENQSNKWVKGFSKLSKDEKIDWVTTRYFHSPDSAKKLLEDYWNKDSQLQLLHDEFIENAVSNFYLPLGVAPNFIINQQAYTIPMATEESSVLAAAGKSAKFWASRGGFSTKIIGTEKIGHVHFMFAGEAHKISDFIENIKPVLHSDTDSITTNMRARGGGITTIELCDKTDQLANYFQLHVSFETIDSMGANFINSCLEQFGDTIKREAIRYAPFSDEEKNIEIVMCILSNHVPRCLVRAEVSCPVEELNEDKELSPQAFCEKFIRAIDIANADIHRAVTHNKGVMNGVDAVVIATGNDFRAVEAGAHAFASSTGNYKSLTHATIENGVFRYWIDIPLALGTVGGITKLHPMVQWSLDLLGNPTAKQLMEVVAVAGLAQNFAAIRSLITSGIQKGHMKMHLMNILNQFKASKTEKQQLIDHFKSHTVSFSAVENELLKIRS